MKFLLSSLALACALVVCPASAIDSASAHNAAPNTAPEAASPPAAAPENGAWGIDLSGMDARIRPGDDFFGFVNGKWVERTPIPDDKQDVGGLNTLQDKALERTRRILDDALADTTAAAGSETRQIGAWYAAYMDEAAIEAAGFGAIRPELQAIDAVADRDQLLALFARNHGAIGARAIVIGVDFDRNEVGKVRPSIDIAPLLLGAREFYLEAPYAPLREARVAHIARLLALAGYDQSDVRARRVHALETRIAQITWPAAELRDDAKKNNVMPLEELARRAPGIDWRRYLSGSGVDATDKVILLTPSSVNGMIALVSGESLDAWKDYMRYAVLLGTSKYLPKSARDEVFDFYGRQLGGQQVPQPRWIDALIDMAGQGRPLSDAVSRRYVERYVSPDARPKAAAMIDNLVAAFDARLGKLSWMAPETRVGARDKLAKLTIKPLYPDVWNSAEGLVLVPDDMMGNARRIAAFSRRKELDWLATYPDRRQFLQPVFLVNAYANSAWNEIVFLAAIMQPPAFDPAADDAVNYGAMGAIIGHEISHLFDDKGRKVNGDGLLADWWTRQDAERFDAMARRLALQVGSYEPLPGKKVNGALTLGESIADVAGLVVAYDAYKRSLGGREPPVLDGYTGDQRFFMSYAQAWRWKGRDAAVDRQMKTDAHPPSAVRPNTVRNIDAWYVAFDVKPGDKLYLKPEDRVKLW